MARVALAKDLLSALSQAKDLGFVEERFQIFDCEFAVRNLRPREYEEIIADCEGSENIQYLNAFQKGHVSRGLVEVNGFDLRGVDFVEDDEHDPKKPGFTRKVRLERHVWVLKNVVNNWSKELLYTAFRKVEDAVNRAEIKSKEGVQFLIPDEVPEDKFRRLLGDLKELESEIPVPLRDRVYEEFGFLLKSTADELKAAEDRLRAVAQEAEEQQIETPVAVQQNEPSVAVQQAPRGDDYVQVVRTPVDMKERAEEAMRTRKPIHQDVSFVPVPVKQEPPPVMPSRAREYENAQSDIDQLVQTYGSPNAPPLPMEIVRPTEVAEIRSRPQLDPVEQQKLAVALIDQPPVAGLNPKFRPPPKM
jgi:hypothetical protein